VTIYVKKVFHIVCSWHYDIKQCYSNICILFRKRPGEIRVIKNTDTVEFHVSGHRIGMAPVRDIPLDDHAVITSNVILVQPCIIMLRITA